MRHVDQTLEPVRAFLPEGWNVRKERSRSRPFHILDSYEGSLLVSGAALLEFPGNPVKMELLPEKIGCEIDEVPHQKSFNPSSLPCSELRDIVAGKAGAWRIGIRGRGIETIDLYRIANEDQKGVARLSVRTFKCEGAPAMQAIVMDPYRGYGDEVAAIKPGIDSIYPLTLIPRELYRRLPDPIHGLSAPVPDVLPTEEARGAVVNLLRYILNRVRYLEPGVLGNSDPEILHQYRVSIRRMRSLVSLLKDVFLPEERETLGNELKSAMQDTNRLRDLDVQMMEVAALRPSLPDSLQPGLDRILQGLGAERGKAFFPVRRSIAGASFDERFSKVVAILGKPSESDPRTIADMLGSAIAKRYRRITRETRALGEETKPEQLHSLRVSCKKLRYLMDFFPQVLHQDSVSPLLKKLKKLQNLLGRHNDLSVMGKFLLEQAKKHRGSSTALMSIGAVILHTHNERRQLTTRCVAAAHNFCSDGNKRLIRNAMGGGKA